MAISVGGLVEAIRKNGLLEPEQQEELGREQGRFTDPRLLARHLVQKNWLTPFQINQVFQGRGAGLVLGSYVLQERIGEGGMGQVFKARHRRLGRSVAVKVIKPQHVENPDAVRRFRREVQAVAQLSHNNIVLAYDADQVGETHFFVMEYVEGLSLGKLVKQHGPPPLSVACDYIKQIAQGLEHAHLRGMVHRDIKPSNLLVTKPTDNSRGPWGATVKILDMGVARLVQPIGDDSVSALTKEGRVVGTPDYMAPEQAVNSAKADIRADLYSLGCTTYYLLAGQAPFAGGTPMEKLLKHRVEAPRPIEQIRPDISPGLAQMVARMMAKKQEERYQTPSEVVAAFEALKTPSAAIPANVPQAIVVGAGQSGGGTAPMAIPISAQASPHIPMAEIITVDHRHGRTSQEGHTWRSSSWWASAPGGVTMPMVIGAAVLVVLGITFMLVALLTLT